MSTTYYAWSTFRTKYDEYGNPQGTIKPGEAVSAGDLGVSDEEFQHLITIGSVRSMPYPVPAGDERSPVELRRDQLREAASAEFMAVLPYGTVPPIQEAPPGSMPIIPQLDERARQAVEKTGFDPDVAPEENDTSASEPDDSKEVQEAQAKALKERKDAESQLQKPQQAPKAPNTATTEEAKK